MNSELLTELSVYRVVTPPVSCPSCWCRRWQKPRWNQPLIAPSGFMPAETASPSTGAPLLGLMRKLRPVSVVIRIRSTVGLNPCRNPLAVGKSIRVTGPPRQKQSVPLVRPPSPRQFVDRRGRACRCWRMC